MLYKNLIRWSGLAAALGGGLHIVGALLHPVGEDLASITHPNYVSAHLVLWASTILLLLGLAGLYSGQAEESGWLGLLGFVLSFLGVAVVSGLIAMVSIAVPLIAAEMPALVDQAMTPPAFTLPFIALGFGLGMILFGVATIRARVLPRWAGWLVIIGTLLQMAEGSPIDEAVLHVIVTTGRVLFGLGLAWMGYGLWAGKRQEAEQRTTTVQL